VSQAESVDQAESTARGFEFAWVLFGSGTHGREHSNWAFLWMAGNLSSTTVSLDACSAEAMMPNWMQGPCRPAAQNVR